MEIILYRCLLSVFDPIPAPFDEPPSKWVLTSMQKQFHHLVPWGSENLDDGSLWINCPTKLKIGYTTKYFLAGVWWNLECQNIFVIVLQTWLSSHGDLHPHLALSLHQPNHILPNQQGRSWWESWCQLRWCWWMIVPTAIQWFVAVLSRSPSWAGPKAGLPESPSIVQRCHWVDQSFPPSQEETLKPLKARKIWPVWSQWAVKYNCGERFSSREISKSLRPAEGRRVLYSHRVKDDFRTERMGLGLKGAGERRGGRESTEVQAADSPVCLSTGWWS